MADGRPHRPLVRQDMRAATPSSRRWVKRVNETVPAGSHVLEVAPGPGFLSIELARSGKYHVTGLDISKTFVEIAQANAREANVPVDFRQGNASDHAVCRRDL